MKKEEYGSIKVSEEGVYIQLSLKFSDFKEEAQNELENHYLAEQNIKNAWKGINFNSVYNACLEVFKEMALQHTYDAIQNIPSIAKRRLKESQLESTVSEPEKD